MPRVESHCAATIGEHMYIYGGYIAEKAVRLADIYALNMEKMEWSLVYKASNTDT